MGAFLSKVISGSKQDAIVQHDAKCAVICVPTFYNAAQRRAVADGGEYSK